MSVRNLALDEQIDNFDLKSLIRTRDDFPLGFTSQIPNFPLFIRADYLHIRDMMDSDSQIIVDIILENQLVLYCHGDSDSNSWTIGDSVSVPHLVKKMQKYEKVDAIVSCNPAGYRIDGVIHTGKGNYYAQLYRDNRDRKKDGIMTLWVSNDITGREIGQIHLTPEVREKYLGKR